MASQNPPCPTLKETCLSVVVDNYQRGVHCQVSGKLITVVSDMIFNKLYTPHLAIPEEQMKKIRDNFCISRIVLGDNNYDKKSRDMMQAQMITKLELLNLKTSMICSPNPNGKRKGFGKRLNLDWFIKKYLNRNCWPLLESLIIQGTGVAFPQGWIVDLHNLCPSITILNITGCSLTNNEFKVLCGTFIKLTSLSFGKTNVNDLRGIEQLTELKHLSLEDLEFKKESCFYPVFLLQNLISLDISSNTLSANTADLLTKRKTPLPNLQFLDVCGNEFSADRETLKTLLAQHPNIQHVAVINTVYERTPQNEFLQFKEGVHFFTTSDLDACSTSLMIYSSHKMRSDTILTDIYRTLMSQLGDQNELDLKKCAKALSLVLMSSTQNYRNQLTAVKCLHIMFSDHLVFPMFTKKEKEDVAKAVIQVIAVVDWTDFRRPFGGYDLFVAGINVLVDFEILVDNLQLITSASIAMVKTFTKRWRSNDDIQVLLLCSGFLTKNKEVLQGFPLTREEYGNLRYSIKTLLGVNGRRRHGCPRVQQSLLEMLTITLDFNNNKDHYTNDELLVAILSGLRAFLLNKYLLELTFACAQVLCTSAETDLYKIFEPRCFWNIEAAMKSRQSFASKAALTFLLQTHNLHTKEWRYSNNELQIMINEIGSFIKLHSLNSVPKNMYVYISESSEILGAKELAAWIAMFKE